MKVLDVEFACRLNVETGGASEDNMLERRSLVRCLGTDSMPDRAALHLDDRMITLLSRRSRGQTSDVLRLDLLHDLLVLTFIPKADCASRIPDSIFEQSN